MKINDLKKTVAEYIKKVPIELAIPAAYLAIAGLSSNSFGIGLLTSAALRAAMRTSQIGAQYLQISIPFTRPNALLEKSYPPIEPLTSAYSSAAVIGIPIVCQIFFNLGLWKIYRTALGYLLPFSSSLADAAAVCVSASIYSAVHIYSEDEALAPKPAQPPISTHQMPTFSEMPAFLSELDTDALSESVLPASSIMSQTFKKTIYKCLEISSHFFRKDFLLGLSYAALSIKWGILAAVGAHSTEYFLELLKRALKPPTLSSEDMANAQELTDIDTTHKNQINPN